MPTTTQYSETARNETQTTGEANLISFVVPVKDEAETLIELFAGIQANVPEEYNFEVIFVDDGSDDESWVVITAMAASHPEQVRGVRFRSNVGKASGLTAGFRAARGEVIFTMDADLQDDPTEIPRFLAKLEEGYDLVSGWKKVRHDPWHKVLPSRIFNRMLSKFSCVKLHDHNCGFKCYRATVAKEMTLFGELHRMVPALAGMKGFEVTEIPVQHHARQHGQSKYGVERFIRGFSDMLTVGFLRRYRERPSHFMNAVACGYLTVAGALGLAGLFTGITSLQGTMLALAGVLLAAMAVATFLAGLVSEQVIRGGLRDQWKLPIVEDTATNDTARPLQVLPTAYRQAA